MTSSTDDAGEVTEAVIPRAIIAGHGAFSQGLISAVQQISGCGDVFVGVSNMGLSGPDIEAAYREQAENTGIRVFFTDLPGGSATMAVRRLMRTHPDIVLVTGTNLPMLLEFVFQADAEPREAAKLAAEKGRAALMAHGGQ